MVKRYCTMQIAERQTDLEVCMLFFLNRTMTSWAVGSLYPDEITPCNLAPISIGCNGIITWGQV
jgi:hypothetical protein